MTDNNVGKFVPVSGTLISVTSWNPNKILPDGSSVVLVGVSETSNNIQSQKDFIQQELIDGIESILQKHKYLSYVLIVSGIEFLGACDDHKDIHKKGESERRFKKAINSFFPNSYKAFENDLYENLRCGLSHVLLAKQTIILSERKHIGAKHLLKDEKGRLNLIVENLFDDFKKACQNVIGKLEKKEIKSKFGMQGPNILN